MTQAASVDVDGAERLTSTLRSAADEIAEMEDAQRDAGRLVEQRARSGAPVDTGALAGSITSSSEGTTVLISSDLVHAGVQEYGSSHTPAHPYARPALEASTDQIVALYAKDAQQALDKVKGA